LINCDCNIRPWQRHLRVIASSDNSSVYTKVVKTNKGKCLSELAEFGEPRELANIVTSLETEERSETEIRTSFMARRPIRMKIVQTLFVLMLSRYEIHYHSYQMICTRYRCEIKIGLREID
jgi:hypothetical protein